MEIDPSLSSLQEASAKLAIVADTAKNQASGKTEMGQTTPPSVSSLTKAIWRRSPGKKDEFWEALQSHYNYLMDGELIQTCKEANCELTCIDPESAYTWTFAEFMHQYQQFLEWIDGIQKEITTAEENGHFNEELQKTCLEELDKRVILRRIFNEQTQRLIKRYPDMEKEIHCQSLHMNTQWERLELTVTAHKNAKDILKDISVNVQCLRKWLREMENKLRPLTAYSGWALEDLETKLAEHQSLRKDIESRGKDVSEILKFFNNVQSGHEDATAADRDVQAIHHIAVKLERRWYTVFLRSFEWECLLDDLIQKSKAGLLREDELESSFSDEPLTKFPRLSGEWTDKMTSCNHNGIVAEDNIQPHSCFFPDSNLDQKLQFDNMEIDSDRDLAAVISGDEMKTRDVGTDYETLEMPSTNEKGVMVGNTGIDQLKADCAGDYQNFEIIQDIGYSSESSTQLSNDERSSEIISNFSYSKRSQFSSEDNVNSEDNPEFDNQAMPQDSDSNSAPISYESECATKNIVNRNGPNCATYYFRHVDTDSECKTDDLASDAEKDLANFYVRSPCTAELSGKKQSENVHSPSFMRRRQWSDTMLSTKPSSARMDVEFLTDVESPQSSLSEEETRINFCMTDSQKLRHLVAVGNKEQEVQVENSETALNGETDEVSEIGLLKNSSKRDSIQQLVEQAERLVQEESKKDVLEQLPQSLWLGEARAKKFRLKEWLHTHQPAACQRPAAMPPETVIDSCDASGEYTSNDSEDEHSVSSEDQNNSVIMCYNMMSPDMVGEEHKMLINESAKTLTPAADKPKVILRSKKRASRDRPWSVTELNQLASSLGTSPFSASENALNKLSSPGQNTNDSILGNRGLGVSQPTVLTHTEGCTKKSKPSKSRKRYTRRSDSGSEGVSHPRNKFLSSGGSDGGIQKSPSHRKQSWHSKSHSSGSDSGRKQCSFSSSSKSASHSSGTDQYSSEVILENSFKQCDESDSDGEVINCVNSEIFNVLPSEELSSLSEQAWDDYQESPYLSEPYSEKLDDEQIKNLVEFGDDYRKYIESHSDTASQSSYSGVYRFPNRQRQAMDWRSQMQYMGKLEPSEVDSDSDWEDLNHILQDSSNQLQYSTKLFHTTMKERASRSNFVDHRELLATCCTNIKCLEGLQKTSAILDKDWPPKLTAAIKTITNQWKMLKSTVQEQQDTSEKLKRVQKEMCELRESMTSIRSSVADYNKQIDNKEMLENMIKEIQNYLASLQDKKTLLLTINLQVHSFLSSGESDVSSLKAEVAALYFLWDQVFEKSNNQLSNLQQLMSAWANYDSSFEELRSMMQKDRCQANAQLHLDDGSSLRTRKIEVLKDGKEHEIPSADTCVETQNLTEEQLMMWNVHFAGLQKQAKQLETMLADTYAWKNITEQLTDVSTELHRRRDSCSKMAITPSCSEKKSACLRVDKEVETSTRNHSIDSKIGDRKHSLLWRVMRAALPFQLAVVVLFCIACLMEPHCCDSLNNFSLSFSPQLRYVRGPPPI